MMMTSSGHPHVSYLGRPPVEEALPASSLASEASTSKRGEIPKTEQVNQSIVSRRRARQPFMSPLTHIVTSGLEEQHSHHASPSNSVDHSHESDFDAELSDGGAGGRSRSPRDYEQPEKRIMYDSEMRPHSPSSVQAPGGSTSASKRVPRALSKSSGYRGVSKCVKDGRWQSRIRVGHRVKYLGRFKTEAEAASRYDEAAIALHGTKATLNFALTEKQMELAAERAKALRPKLGFTSGDLFDIQEGGDWHSDTSVPPSRSNSPTLSSASTYFSASTEDDRFAAMGLMSLRHSFMPVHESPFMIVEEEES